MKPATRFRRRVAVCVMALALLLLDVGVLAASEHHGRVNFGGLPVPGATVAATQGDKHAVAITDQEGVYTFTDLADGVWTMQVEMLGFATQTQEVTVAPDTPGPMWELKLLPFAEITRGVAPASPAAAPAAGSSSSASAGAAPAGAAAAPAPPAAKPGFQAANVNAAAGATPVPATPAPPTPAPPSDTTNAVGDATTASDLSQRAAQGLLVNGSVNNGAASPFAQLAAFGNNRTGGKSLYNGVVGTIFDTSAWDAAPFSLIGLATPKASYNDVQFVGAFGGPIGIPHHLVSNSNFVVLYQHTANHNAAAQWGRVPTMLERGGDFLQTLGANGQPVQIYDPSTGLPIAGNALLPGQVSSQAKALLGLYPMPNVNSAAGYNYQAPVLNSSLEDSVQSRFTKTVGGFKNQIFGNIAYQATTNSTTNLFGFEDTTTLSGIDAAFNWSRRVSTFFTTHFKYEYSRLATDTTPYFANRTNVSGAAGILGNNQDAVNWGPPNLNFSSGVAGLSQGAYARNANQTQTWTFDALRYHGRHTLQFGGDFRRQQFNIVSQQDPRGTFAFTGAATAAHSGGVPVAGTGSDLADFLLGVPDTSSIAFGNADKYLRGWGYDAFVNDDWRISSGITLNVGLRWEYSGPFTELRDRLVNLDVAPGFTSAGAVVASNPTGPVTGQDYPASLLNADRLGFEPRIGIAWRPIPASSLVIRAGYGIYDNTSVYQLIAMQMAQQPPLSKTLSLQNSAASPLTLATAFNAAPSSTPNTYGVDPKFLLGYAQNWQASVQMDIPGALTMTATYLGTKGTHLMQEFLPNTYPLGATNPCPLCPAGFVYLTSNGNSTRQAGQIQVRRRLHGGLTATVQYTYAKAIDDAGAFGGATLNQAAIAQNWLDLRADRARSNFDQRHLLTLQTQYTVGEGLGRAALLSGWKGRVLKEWTVTSQLTIGSGLPLTPVYLAAVTGTGVVGTIRPDYTGAAVGAAPAGYFLNPAAYTAPLPGQWGNAGRDSITGPAQFTLNASLMRTFRLNNRLNADWRVDATNVLNHLTYSSWNTTVSPLFGLPNQANLMRKLQTTFRVRF